MMCAAKSIAPTLNVIDYDVHGMVGIRLIDPNPAMSRRLDRLAQNCRCHLNRVPDLTIRRNANVKGTMADAVRPGGYAAVDRGMLIYDATGRRATLVPFDTLGQAPCEILCDSSIDSVPLVEDIICALATRSGVLPVHGAAFVHQGHGVLVAGPPHCGKTGVLLAFVQRGASFVSDEPVFVRVHDRRMFGIGALVEISADHCENAPALRRSIPLCHRALWAALRAVAPWRSMRHVPLVSKAVVGWPQSARVSISPFALCGAIGGETASCESLVLLRTSGQDAGPASRVRSSVAARYLADAATCLHQHLSHFYQVWTAIFPTRRNAFLEDLAKREQVFAQNIADGVDAVIYDPMYPIKFETAYTALKSVLA